MNPSQECDQLPRPGSSRNSGRLPPRLCAEALHRPAAPGRAEGGSENCWVHGPPRRRGEAVGRGLSPLAAFFSDSGRRERAERLCLTPAHPQSAPQKTCPPQNLPRLNFAHKPRSAQRSQACKHDLRPETAHPRTGNVAIGAASSPGAPCCRLCLGTRHTPSSPATPVRASHVEGARQTDVREAGETPGEPPRQ